jgi:hypothetical protein
MVMARERALGAAVTAPVGAGTCGGYLWLASAVRNSGY